MITLTELHADIETRVKSIRSEYPDWLCRRGCDGCCHRLAEVPQLTAAEWGLLLDGLNLLPQTLLQHIFKAISTLGEQQTRPIVCPFLDLSTGSCQVYFHRPIACRTYGFYVQRDKGLYCQDIKNQVDCGNLEYVVWGNQDGIDHRLKSTGETRTLTEWFLHEIQSASEGEPV